MPEQTFFLNNQEASAHTMIFGASGRGKSLYLQDEAKRLGISYEEMLLRCEPTAEMKERQKTIDDIERQKNLLRLDAVRHAYLNASDINSPEFSDLSDLMREHCNIESPTSEQRRQLFLMLPQSIIGAGIQWGFSDTEVRDSISIYISFHRVDIAEKLNRIVQ